jgi:Reverse transcriptase (RNA-dependent DNA polymerase)
MDVRNTFLQENLEEEVYTTLPPRHKKEHDSTLMCKLIKSIYGLKQSSRTWDEKLSSYLILRDFKISNADHSLFIKIDHTYITIILVYVNDIIIIENNWKNIQQIKRQLKNRFDIKDLGHLKYFLGIEVAYSNGSLFLSQRKYVLDLLKETRKLGCKTSSTSIDSKNKLNIDEGTLLENINQYQRIVGKLIYLTVIRPDLAYAINQISPFMNTPKTYHLEAINKILRYLKGTPEKGILMKNNRSNVVIPMQIEPLL